MASFVRSGSAVEQCAPLAMTGMSTLHVPASQSIATMASFNVTASSPTGVLASWYDSGADAFAAVVLVSGRVLLYVGEGEVDQVVLTSSTTINDGNFHTISVQITASSVVLQVDGSNAPGSGPQALTTVAALSQDMHLGMLSDDIQSTLLRQLSLPGYKGCLARARVNGLDVFANRGGLTPQELYPCV